MLTNKPTSPPIRPASLIYRGRLVLAAFAVLLVLLIVYQVQPHSFKLEVGTPGDETYVASVYAQENNPAFNYRWTRKRSYVNLYYPGAPYALSVRVAAPRPNNQAVNLQIVANGKTLGSFQVTGEPQVINLTTRQILFGPEELAVELRTDDVLAESGGRGELGVALDWIEVKGQPGLILPPPFVIGWWLLIIGLGWLWARWLGLREPVGWGIGGLSLGTITLLYSVPATARYLWSDWLVVGLQVVIGQLILIALLSLISRFWLRPARLNISPAWVLFVGLLLLYVSTARGYLSYGDDGIMEAATANIAEGRAAAPIGTDPPHSKYGIGQSLLGVPLFALGSWAAKTFPFMLSERAGVRGLIIYLVLLVGPLVTALAAVVLYWLARLLGCSRWAAFTVGVLFGLTTISWHYARTYLSEPLVTLCLLTALTATLLYTRSNKTGWVLLSGFALGLAVATRTFNLAIVPVFGVWLLANWWRGGHLWRSFWKLVVGGLPILAWIGVIGWWNWARFGSPLETGYGSELTQFTTPLLEGLYGELFGPGKGIFLYSPVLLLGIAGWPALWRRKDGRSIAIVIAIISLEYVLIYGSWYTWFGGGVWGGRFLVPLIPLLLLPAGPLLEELVLTLTQKRLAAKAALILSGLFISTVIISLLIQMLSVVISYQIYATEYARNAGLFHQMLYNLPDTAIVRHFVLWQEQTRPDFASRFYHETPFARWVDVVQSGAWLALIGLLLISGLLVLSKFRPKTGELSHP